MQIPGNGIIALKKTALPAAGAWSNPVEIPARGTDEISLTLTYTPGLNVTGRFIMAWDEFDGSQWIPVSIEDIGSLVTIASPSAGFQTDVNVAVKRFPSATAVYTINYKISVLEAQKIRVRFAEVGTIATPGSIAVTFVPA